MGTKGLQQKLGELRGFRGIATGTKKFCEKLKGFRSFAGIIVSLLEWLRQSADPIVLPRRTYLASFGLATLI